MKIRSSLTMVLGLALLSGCKDSQLSLTGYVASMSCSKAFVSGFPEQQINQQDLELITSGSSNNAKPQINHSDQSTSSKIFTTQKRAIYRPGLGCTLVGDKSGVSDETSLRQQQMPSVAKVELSDEVLWPQGNKAADQLLTANQLNEIDRASDVIFSENKNYQVASHSLAIAYQGQLVYQRYAEGIDSETPIYGFSLGKTLASLLAGKLSSQGLLDIHQPIDYLAWNDERSNITAHHLLTMTSGLEFDESYENATSDANMLFVADDMASLAVHKAANATAGEEFKYSTANTLILADVFNQKLAGLENTYLAFQNLMREISVNNALVQADGVGTMTFGMKNLIASHDLLRLGQFMLQKGQWQQEQVIPTSWFDYMLTANNGTMRAENKLQKSYGAGVWLNHAQPYGKVFNSLPEDTFLALGMRGQYVIVIPSHELVIVRTGTTLDLDSFDYLSEMDKFAAALVEQLAL